MNRKRNIYLIDGSSYIYRAFYAIRRLTNSRGMPTQAVYGFVQMLLKVLRDAQPDHVCVVFDAPGPNFRHEMYEPYKATRQKAPEDLVVQVPWIKDFVRCQGVPQFEMEGFEADDLIAALASWAAGRGLEVVIVSGDKDLFQLISDPDIRQWDPQRDIVFTEATVMERLGVTPAQMRDYLALVGDSSDNVPGVKGVGEKTARQLLDRWKSLDGIYAHLDEITPESVRKKLEEHRDMAYLSRRLVSFSEECRMNSRLDDFVPGHPSIPDLARFFEELDFRTLLESLRNEWEASADVPGGEAPRETREDLVVADADELSAMVREIEKHPVVAVQVDTTSDSSMNAKFAGLALSVTEHHAFYIPFVDGGSSGGAGLSRDEVIRVLGPVLAGSDRIKWGHDLKHAWVVLKRHGVDPGGIGFDTLVAAYLLNPGEPSGGFDRIAAEWLGEKWGAGTEPGGSGRKGASPDAVDALRAAGPACRVAETCLRVVPVLKRRLEEDGLLALYEGIELPLIRVLAAMEYRGILVDAEKLESLSIDLEKALDRITGEIYSLAGEEFNIQSPKQLAGVLFDRLGLRVVKKTKSGPSTDMNVLEELAAEHPIVEHVLAHRTLAKLKGTYVDALSRLIHPETGRIHTRFNQAVTATGRLSSSDPNLQNIPIRTEEGRKIRKAFVAASGHVLMSADYSQIELRILAHYSRDDRLEEAFREGADVHGRTAAEIFGVGPLDVTPEMRRQAKMINFGIIYGMGPFGLARRLRISNKTARVIIEKYFERYRGVKVFIDSVVERARSAGYSETLLGRRRAIPELRSRNHTVRQLGERLAVNTPIQGTAADLIKKAMVEIDTELSRRGFGAAMLLQVHDELVFEVPEAELDAVRTLVKERMEKVWPLTVPLTVDFGWGPDWAEAHP